MCAAFRNSDYCSPQRHQTELKNHTGTAKPFQDKCFISQTNCRNRDGVTTKYNQGQNGRRLFL